MKEHRKNFGGGAGLQLATDTDGEPDHTATRAKPRRRPNPGPRVAEVIVGLHEPEAHEVYVCEDFNDCSPHSLPMIRNEETGRWEKRLILAAGRYCYKFVVDGRWVHDCAAQENVNNEHGSLNSVLEVTV